jgi:hypothetical protein
MNGSISSQQVKELQFFVLTTPVSVALTGMGKLRILVAEVIVNLLYCKHILSSL